MSDDVSVVENPPKNKFIKKSISIFKPVSETEMLYLVNI